MKKIIFGILAVGMSLSAAAQTSNFFQLRDQVDGRLKQCMEKVVNDGEASVCFENAYTQYLEYAAKKHPKPWSASENRQFNIYTSLFKKCDDFSTGDNFSVYTFSQTQGCQLTIAKMFAADGEASYLENQ